MGSPSQIREPSSKCGVTVIVATTGESVEFDVVNTGIFPDPVASSPIEGVSFSQVKLTFPLVTVLRSISEVNCPLQKVRSEGSVTFGVGRTVTITSAGPEAHPVMGVTG